MQKISANLIIYKILKQLSTLITTAFAVAAGYEWQSTIKKLIQDNVEIDEQNILIYPLVITIIAVVATIAIESISLMFMSSESMIEVKEEENNYKKDKNM